MRTDDANDMISKKKKSKLLQGRIACEAVAKTLKRQLDMDCFRYLETGRPGVSESFLRLSPNLKNSEPPSSESKEVFRN